MILTETTKRLVIYFFYDREGIIDDYVPVMLKEVKQHCTELCFVSNGMLDFCSQEKVQDIVDKLIIRDNKGFDVWAYKEALASYGWEGLNNYDEVIIMNYTLFGPLRPFEQMFKCMNRKDIDFWGITKHHQVDFDCFHTCKYGYIPEHIQSSFIAFRKSLFNTKFFQKFWDDLPMINSYGESVGKFEVILTKELTDAGFLSQVYVDTSDLEGFTRYPLMMMSDELIINRNCPVIKLKSFYQDYADIIGDTLGNCSVDSLDFIKKELTYNTDLIWQHILRVANQSDIKNIMHLNYILPRDYQLKPCNSDIVYKVAIIAHIYYEDEVDNTLTYFKSMPQGVDCYVTVTDSGLVDCVREKLIAMQKFSKIKVAQIENQGRDVSSLLVANAPHLLNYDLVCFVHDKKTKQLKPYCQGRSFAYQCYENTLGSVDYVANIIQKFIDTHRLGMLVPPPPTHGSYWFIPGNSWCSNFQITKELHERLSLHVDIDEKKEPIAPLGTMFWFRPKALAQLINKPWNYSDFPAEPNNNDGTLLHAIERIYPFVVQEAGYFTAWTMTDRFARIYMTNLYYFLSKYNAYAWNGGFSFRRRLLQMLPRGLYFGLKQIIPVSIWNTLKRIYYRK